MAELSTMRLVLGVGAGIAAYKCAELVRRVREQGAEVQVVMTDSARHFVGAATFQALSGRAVRSSRSSHGAARCDSAPAKSTISPCSMNTMSREKPGTSNAISAPPW